MGLFCRPDNEMGLKRGGIGFVFVWFLDYVTDSKPLLGFVPLKNKPFFGSSFLTALFLRYRTLH